MGYILPTIRDKTVVSLQLIGVGTRHSRVLRFYHSGFTGIDIGFYCLPQSTIPVTVFLGTDVGFNKNKAAFFAVSSDS